MRGTRFVGGDARHAARGTRMADAWTRATRASPAEAEERRTVPPSSGLSGRGRDKTGAGGAEPPVAERVRSQELGLCACGRAPEVRTWGRMEIASSESSAKEASGGKEMTNVIAREESLGLSFLSLLIQICLTKCIYLVFWR